jgi:hypothetical protein
MSKRSRATGRAERGSYINLPHELLQHSNWLDASPGAIKLFMYLAGQYRGHNNGDLSCSFTTMKAHGWTSNAGLARAIKELLARQLIVRTRRGARRGACHLFALTCKPINDSDKLDHDITPSPIAGNEWKRGPDLALMADFQPHIRDRMTQMRDPLPQIRDETPDKVPNMVQPEGVLTTSQPQIWPSSSNTRSGACGEADSLPPESDHLGLETAGGSNLPLPSALEKPAPKWVQPLSPEARLAKIALAAKQWPSSDNELLAKLSGSTLEEVQQWRATAA